MPTSSFSFWAGSTFWARPKPSFEYAFVFVSLSTILNRSICCKQVKPRQRHNYSRFSSLRDLADGISAVSCWQVLKDPELEKKLEIRDSSRPSCSRPSWCRLVAQIQSFSAVLIRGSGGAWQPPSWRQTSYRDAPLSVRKVRMSASGGGGRLKGELWRIFAFSENFSVSHLWVQELLKVSLSWALFITGCRNWSELGLSMETSRLPRRPALEDIVKHLTAQTSTSVHLSWTRSWSRQVLHMINLSVSFRSHSTVLFYWTCLITRGPKRLQQLQTVQIIPLKT